jgi:hypothetical protein
METTNKLTTFEQLRDGFAKLGYTLEFSTNGKYMQPVARCYRIKEKSKHKGIEYLFNYRYINDDMRLNSCNDELNRLIKWQQRKEAEANERKALNDKFKASDYYKVGDIVVNSWGYEQTNVEFYKVIEVLPKSINVIEIGSEFIKSNGLSPMAGRVIPVPDKIVGDKPFILRLKMSKSYDGEIHCYICNPKRYYNFSKWDGKPEYCSWYA